MPIESTGKTEVLLESNKGAMVESAAKLLISLNTACNPRHLSNSGEALTMPLLA